MADVKISGLPSAGTLTGAEYVPVVQSGTTVKATVSQFSGGVAQITSTGNTLTLTPSGGTGVVDLEVTGIPIASLTDGTQAAVGSPLNSMQLTDVLPFENLATTNTYKTTIQELMGMAAYKPPVNVVSTTNIATLSGFPTVDTVTLTTGQLVLLTNQTTGSQNGPWVVGSGSWTRPVWYSSNSSGGASSTTASAGQAYLNTIVQVLFGNVNAGSVWFIQSAGASPIIIDQTTTTWTKLSLNAGSVAPSGNPTNVQYNNSGTLGGDAGFTYSGSGTAIVTLGTGSIPGTLTTPPATSANSLALTIKTGATTTSGVTGALSLQTGTPAANSNSGGCGLVSGSATGTGSSGTVTIGTGSTASGNTGGLNLTTGQATVAGSSGALTIATGAAAGSGQTVGPINISTGTAVSGATPGNIGLTASGSINLFGTASLAIASGATSTGNGLVLDTNQNYIFGQGSAGATSGTGGGGGALADQGYYYRTSGASISCPAYTTTIVLNYTANTNITVLLPSSPVDGQLFEATNAANFTMTTTWQDSGGTTANVLGSQGTLSPYTTQGYRYLAVISKWVRRF